MVIIKHLKGFAWARTVQTITTTIKKQVKIVVLSSCFRKIMMWCSIPKWSMSQW